jgi:hypothetical protein
MKFLGGLYAVALPTAEYAVLYPGSHIESLWGKIDLPGFDIIEFDITAAHGGKLAGKAQTNDPAKWGTWMWHAATREWEHVSSSAHGTYPCIFTADGVLALADGAHNGSQGWRYVDEHGRLVTGDDTLNHQRRVGQELGLSDLWEFSHFAGVTIGQGDPPIGCHVLIDGTRRMLEPGGTHFIRVKYAQGIWAISTTKLAENTSVIHRMTRAQLSQLPPVTAAPPVVVQPPIPEPPKPEPEPVSVPNHIDLARQFLGPRLKRIEGDTEATRANSFAALNALCLELRKSDTNFGLLEKTGGAKVRDRAADILAYRIGSEAHLIDVIGDAEGEDGVPSVGWGLVPEHERGIRSIDEWRLPYAAVVTPPPTPEQPPVEPPPDASQMDRIEAQLARLSFHLGLR